MIAKAPLDRKGTKTTNFDMDFDEIRREKCINNVRNFQTKFLFPRLIKNSPTYSI